nr:MAG TPA: hypothetical protein [Caudoviricetes sp.]DAX37358.1 MAG TPA: hypothetical protein [Caudoviricetes sp.]
MPPKWRRASTTVTRRLAVFPEGILFPRIDPS